MIEVETSVVIRRPIADVFSFISNVENLPRWAEVALEARRTSPEPLGVGTRFQAVTEFFGRNVKAEYVVTEYDPDRRVSIKTLAGPMLLQNTYTFEPVDGGTHVHVRSRGERGGVPRVVERLAAPVIERQFRIDHQNLKRVLEAENDDET